MAKHYSLEEGGIQPGGFGRVMTLCNVPPPGSPIDNVHSYLGTAPAQAPAVAPADATQGWNTVMNYEPGM